MVANCPNEWHKPTLETAAFPSPVSVGDGRNPSAQTKLAYKAPIPNCAVPIVTGCGKTFNTFLFTTIKNKIKDRQIGYDSSKAEHKRLESKAKRNR